MKKPFLSHEMSLSALEILPCSVDQSNNGVAIAVYMYNNFHIDNILSAEHYQLGFVPRITALNVLRMKTEKKFAAHFRHFTVI